MSNIKRLPDWFEKDRWFMMIDNFVCQVINPDDWYIELAQDPRDSNDGKHRVWYTHNLNKKAFHASMRNGQEVEIIYGSHWKE